MRILTGSVLGFMCLILSGCDRSNLPEYWLCHGDTTQRVYDQQGVLLEEYSGNDPIMLEIFGSKIYQFLSPAYSSEYFICPDSSGKHLLAFQSGVCVEKQDAVQRSKIPNRTGNLDPGTGQLMIGELRAFDNKKIISNGSFSCHKLGHSFSFNDFNHAKD